MTIDHIDDFLNRVPPNNETAESGVLGAIILDPNCIDEVSEIVSVEDFYVDTNKKIFRHMLGMRDAGLGIDAVTLLQKLEDSGDIKKDVAIPRLGEISQAVPSPLHAIHYAKIVAELARRRKVIFAATAMLADGYDQTRPIDDVVTNCEASLQKIPSGDFGGEPVPFGKSLIDACSLVDEIASRGRAAGMITGLDSFDLEAGGLFESELTILAARPSIGKTSMAMQIAQNVAAKGQHVYFASLEMRNTELALRILCGCSAVPMSRVRSGRVGPADFSNMAAVSNGLHSLPIVLHDRAGLSVQDIRRACRRLKAKGELDLIVVDYLQRITPADRRANRHLQVGQITWDLKALALELKVPVLCLSQLGRAAEDRDKNGFVVEPRLAHLKESGDIEQDADMVLLLHRQPRATNAVMILAKNRQGSQARFNLVWDAERTRFYVPGQGNNFR